MRIVLALISYGIMGLACPASFAQFTANCPLTSSHQNWTNCRGSIIFQDGVYIGDFRNGQPNGFGKFSFTDGYTYEGQVKDGLFQGNGTLTRQKTSIQIESKYIGDFDQGRRHGLGILFQGTSIFAGEFQHGYQTGFGVLSVDPKEIPKIGLFKDIELIEAQSYRTGCSYAYLQCEQNANDQTFEKLARLNPRIRQAYEYEITSRFAEAKKYFRDQLRENIQNNPDSKELPKLVQYLNLLTASTTGSIKDGVPDGFWRADPPFYIYVIKGKTLGLPVHEAAKILSTHISTGNVYIIRQNNDVEFNIDGSRLICGDCDISYLRRLWLKTYRELR